jgi:hypothetical protein
MKGILTLDVLTAITPAPEVAIPDNALPAGKQPLVTLPVVKPAEYAVPAGWAKQTLPICLGQMGKTHYL